MENKLYNFIMGYNNPLIKYEPVQEYKLNIKINGINNRSNLDICNLSFKFYIEDNIYIDLKKYDLNFVNKMFSEEQISEISNLLVNKLEENKNDNSYNLTSETINNLILKEIEFKDNVFNLSTTLLVHKKGTP